MASGGTIIPAQRMNANADAQVLETAMNGLGTDEMAIIDILTSRSVQQRQQIATAYKASFGKDLKERLKSELSGGFRKAVLLSFYDRAHVNARSCFKAVKGAGTDEKILIDVICTADPNEIADLKHAYTDILSEEKQNTIRRNLEIDVQKDLSGDFEKIIIALLQGKREADVNEHLVDKDAEELYLGGEGKRGTDESLFTRIFVTRSYAALRAIDVVYKNKVGNDLFKAIDKETSGDYKKALLTILKTAYNKNECIADILYESMKGAGTHDDSLIRVIMANAETSMVAIRNAFNAKYTKKSLTDMVKGDISGDYEKFILAMLGEQ